MARRAPVSTLPSFKVMLWRGLRRRCPWCNGRGAFFTGWFRKQDRCRSCGLDYQRGYEGFELGALAISAVVVFGVLIAGLAVGVVATLPDIAVPQLILSLGIGAIVLPVIVYPISYTVWQAVDLAMRPPDLADRTIPPPVLGWR